MLNLFFCMRRKKNSGVGKGLRAGDREERDSGDSEASLCATGSNSMPGRPGSPRIAGPGHRDAGGVCGGPAHSLSPSQGAVRKEPNIPGAPAASPVGLAGRGRAVSPRAALPPRGQLDLDWGQVSRARSRAHCREGAPGHRGRGTSAPGAELHSRPTAR